MKPITSRHAVLRVGALCAIGALATLAACEAKIPTAAEIQTMDVAEAERTATSAKMVDERHLANMTFFVDGKRVAADVAHAITPTQIATMRMEQGADDQTTIHITTNGQPASASEATQPRTLTHLARMHAMMHGETPVGATSAPASTRELTPEQQARRASLNLALQGETPAGATMLKTPALGNAMIFVDGVRVDAAAFQHLDHSQIASVEIIKGLRAATLYADPLAANGVIVVTTKAAAAKGK